MGLTPGDLSNLNPQESVGTSPAGARKCRAVHQHSETDGASGVATGGKRGNLLPPPQPPIGHPVRSMQIRGDFHVGKKWGLGSQDLFSHASTLRRTFFGLAITKKEGAEEVVEGVILVSPQ